MKVINLNLLSLILCLGACKQLSMVRRIIPENTKWAINTRISCSNYLYITKNYPYNGNIVANLTEFKKKGLITDFAQSDNSETTTFKISFIKADTINVTKLLIPFRGGYSKEVLNTFDRLFISNCVNSVADTIFFKEHGKKATDKFVWDSDILRKYKFYSRRPE